MHGHHHHHHAPEQSSEKRIALAFFLNLLFSIIEFIGGMLTQSTAIMADAVHDLGDSLSIGTAWVLQRLGRRSANYTFTYGYRRLSLLGAALNGLILLAGSAWVLSEAFNRLNNPIMPVTEGMFLLAILGVCVNGYAAYRLSKGNTLNERVLNWHLIEDVLGWCAVLILSIVLHFFHWPILDPLLSIAFTLFILFNVARMLWSTAKLFFQAVPDTQLLHDVRQTLLGLPGTQAVHHLHLWSLDGEKHVLTAHVVVQNDTSISDYQNIKADLKIALEQFNLSHTTIEIELSQEDCRDAGL
ncbi:cation diffusion facilitator family transporter [Neopusillimonas maritima]|jgi:cobalt-zinc-cadmium efflux system protein|uniref:Cation transporter n=1 Tax=Neopusillimonas maritima TaxID=2026239 RepID=A0ABX9MVI6_9BURK|nr:cation diffusion facilitator family transporter [Neopusillimonas maritima]RII82899.1 cation transporter [Neopusillimonas maritima]